MFISRRHFIAGASAATAGLIVPSFAERVLAHVATFGEPLLELSPQTNCLWHALPVDLEDSCLQHRLNEIRTGIRIEIAPDGLY